MAAFEFLDRVNGVAVRVMEGMVGLDVPESACLTPEEAMRLGGAIIRAAISGMGAGLPPRLIVLAIPPGMDMAEARRVFASGGPPLAILQDGPAPTPGH